MALAKIKKIQLIAAKKDRTKILEILQNVGTLEVSEHKEPATYQNIHNLQETELTFQNLAFAIKLLSNYTKKRGLFTAPKTLTLEEAAEIADKFDHKEIIEKCLQLEEETVKAKNGISYVENELATLKAWGKLHISLENLKGTETTKTIIGSVKLSNHKEFSENINKISPLISMESVNTTTTDSHILIIFNKELEKEIRQIMVEAKFTEADLPKIKGTVKDHIHNLKKELNENEEKLIKIAEDLQTLAKNMEKLEICYDYFGWQLEKLEAERKFGDTQHTFIINGWIPEKKIKKLEEELEKETNEFLISEIQLTEGEIPPVIISNSKFLTPFEAVSKIYGLPKHDELDPTPFLAAYFIIFFALCLTDAGYGLIMFIATALALKYIHLEPGIRNLVKLLMYGGLVTFVIGTIFGGWFGLTPDQVPAFLTYTADNGETLFIFQKINALSDPITVLILSLALGFTEILMGVTIKFVHNYKNGDKKDAILSDGTWVFMLTAIGFFILAKAGVLPEQFGAICQWWVIIASIILILTQGRDKKNIFAKLISGILSLYALVGYMSDILSYSRLLALGLATAIIGLAVNTVTGLVAGIPYIGWLLMIIVFIGGHTFNLGINALGAFIHSGRLQFVEFFTKFMEGGGDEFKPFNKKTKYILIKNNS